MISDRSKPKSEERRAWLGLLLGFIALPLVFVPGAPAEHMLGSGAGAEDEPREAIVLVLTDADGAPVADAKAWLGTPTDGPPSGTTDATGRLVLPWPSGYEGSLPLAIRAEGFAIHRLLVPYPGGRRELALTLVPEVTVAGIVIDLDGAPLPAATLELRPDDAPTAPPTSVTTDDQGRFRIEGVPAERVVLQARHTGHEPAVRTIELGSGGREHLVMILRRAGALAGRVLRPDGGGAAGAEVVLAGSGVWPPRRMRTDGQGRFAWPGLPRGVYEIRAHQGSLVSDPIEGLEIGPDQRRSVTLRLSPGLALRGKVVEGASGRPIEGAVVTASEEELSLIANVGRSESDGSFEIPGLRPRPHLLTVEADGYVRHGPEEVRPGGEALTIPMVPAATVSGRVLDARDRPVAGATIRVLGNEVLGAPFGGSFRRALLTQQIHGPVLVEAGGPLGVTLGEVPPIPTDPGMGIAASGGSQVRTDAEGRFALESLPPGTLQIEAYHDRYAPGDTAPFRLRAGEHRDGVLIVLPDGGEVYGRVLDDAEQPLPGVVVSLHAEREPGPRTQVSGEDGSFHFRGVLGETVLTAIPTGDTPSARERLSIRSGEEREIDLILSRDLEALTGRVYDPDGYPVAGARISLTALDPDRPLQRSEVAGEDGTFELRALPPPPYRIEVDHPGFAPFVLGRVASNQGELRVDLGPAASLGGQLWDERREQPVPGRVVVRQEGRVVARRTTTADGRFFVERLGLGTVTVEASASGHLDRALTERLERDTYGEAALDLGRVALASAGRVRGRVVDGIGEPMPGVTVRLEGRAEVPLPTATTDPGGRFELPAVPTGTFTAVVDHPSAGRAEEGPFRIEPGDDRSDLYLRAPGRFEESADGPAAEVVRGVAITVRDGRQGVVVDWVAEGSAAARAGIRRRDVIVAVDDLAVDLAAEARAELRGPEGVPALIEIDHQGGLRTLRVQREIHRPPR